MENRSKNEKVSTLRAVLNELKKHPFPRFFWGKETAGTVNSPFQLMHYLLKEGVVQIEVGGEIHEFNFRGAPELRIVEVRTYEVIEVRRFD